jgi:hypothetical protein
LGIFCRDASGTTTTGFNGTVNLTLDNDNGTITPTTVTITNGSWIGHVAVTGTNLAVITVSDSQGHTGKSYPLDIYAPTPTPSVPEFPITATLVAVLFAVSLLLILGKRKLTIINH